MSSSENHTVPVRVKNNVTGALRTWRHLTKWGHAACVLVTGFGYLLGYGSGGGDPIMAAVFAATYAAYSVVLARRLTDITEQDGG